jgi:tetratricopeptide (TPR) repeat protein
VQFYPELLKIAYSKGTIKSSVHLTPGMARLEDLIRDQGWSKTEAFFEETKKADPQADIFKEAPLNRLGYRLMAAGKTPDAVGVLQEVVKDYPNSANAYDSLADAYLAAGDKQQAQIFTAKALELLDKDSSVTGPRKEAIEKSAKDRLGKLQAKN